MNSRLLFAAALSAALVLAACSSDTSSSPAATSPAIAPTTSTEPTSTEPAATESPVTEPTSTAPATIEPATTEPETTEPATTAAPDPTSVAARPSAGCGVDVSTPGEHIVAETDMARVGRVLDILPSAYDGTTPLPLVLDLHGYQESIEIHRLMSKFDVAGEQYGFAVALPQTDDEVPRWDASVGSTDVAFVGQVIDQELATHCIDAARVYVAGLSNGAFMASAVACDLSDRVAAVAPVAGIRDPAGCVFGRPVPVIAFHGTADTFVSYDGGLGPSVANLPTDGGGTLGTAAVTADGPSVEEIASAWAGRNGCAATPPASTAVAADVTLLAFDCPASAPVELYRIEGGGHAWPGSDFSASIESIVGKTTFSIDATELIWEFFTMHPLVDQ